jgi:Trp operon repressor
MVVFVLQMLLTESERDRVGTNWRVLRMKLNNKLPVHSSQNKLVAFNAVERGDTIHVNIPSGK